MVRFHLFVAFVLCVFSNCYSEIDVEEKDRLLNGFVDYLNNLPSQPYSYDDGVLLSAHKTDDNCYRIEARFKVTEIHNLDSVRYLKCTATVVDHLQNRISVLNHEYLCEDAGSNDDSVGHYEEVVPDPSTVEPPVQRRPVQLDNEVQPNTETTSGEQFVAIPREEPIQRGNARCIGCGTRVNPEAPGVSELAAVGIKQLDRHEPNTKHSLNRVLDVERQVQVVNGVRYILTLLVDYNNCTEIETETCFLTQPCKISILEKPWLKLPSGVKYRAIVANNCTDKWLFGDNGEVVSETSDENKEDNNIDINPNIDNDKAKDSVKPTPDYDKITNTGAVDDVLKVIHNTDLQSQQEPKILSEEEVKKIEEQIIPCDKFEHSTVTYGVVTETSTNVDISKQHNVEVESVKHNSDHVETETHLGDMPRPISEDKKKAIDELMNFFDFAGFNSNRDRREYTRMKRSFDYDLQILSLAKKFNKIRDNIKNAKYIFSVAQSMIDYLNEIDMEEKKRILKDVVAADEESNNEQHFMYIQARVIISCEKAECESTDSIPKICNGVIDITNRKSPQILSAFCYEENDKMPNLGKILEVPLNDHVLQKLINRAIKKIEFESAYNNAMKIIKILNANTQKVSGTLTKISAALAYTNCSKTTSFARRKNCTVLEDLGTNLCDIDIIERHKLKETKVTYICTESPWDESFTSTVEITKSIENMKNPKIIQMVEDALQYLELQSNRNNKQKVVEVKSVSTQVIAGLLTTIEFVVGYTKCGNEYEVDTNKCDILENENLRNCRAQIWHRPWLEYGKQMNVTCDDTQSLSDDNIEQYRTKRSLDFVGGKQPQDTKNPRYIQLAEESLQKYLQTSGVNKQHRVVQIEKVTTQIVSGIKTEMEFLVSPASCVVKNNDNKLSECNVQNSAESVKCQSVIWEQSWNDFKEINVTCEINDEEKSRVRRESGVLYEVGPNDLGFEALHKNLKNKRQIRGGESERDPNDSRYKILAEKSLQKYLQTSGSTQQLKVIKMDKVTVQVVSGTLTRLYFTVSSDAENKGDIIKCNSKVWEQPWLNKTEIDVQCQIANENVRDKRQIPGGESERDPNDSRYKTLAEKSLQKYLQTSGSSQQLKVMKLDKVTVQVVSGTLTRLYFTVSSDTENKGDIIKCNSKVWEQPWLNKTEIDVQCQIANENLRDKRQIPGGESEKDPNDSRYKTLAEQSLQKYIQTSGSGQQLKIVKVDKVTEQVVSGKLTKLYFTVSSDTQNKGDVIKCNSEVWEQPWLHNKEIKVTCQIDEENSRTKREVIRDNRRKVGGKVHQDPSNPKYKSLAEDSLRKYERLQKSDSEHLVLEVKKVTTKVVSGVIYEIDYIATQTSCAANNIDDSACISPSNRTLLYCHTKIWDRPWLKQKEIDVSCNADSDEDSSLEVTEKQHSDVGREIRSFKLGGIEQQDVDKEEYRLMVEKAMRDYEQTSSTKYRHKLIKIHEVTEQVVAGTITKIVYTMAPTTCLLEETSSDCPIQKSKQLRCHVEIWEKPGLDGVQDINVGCRQSHSNDNTRGKWRQRRQIDVDENDIDENMKYYYAERAVQQINDHSDTDNLHKLITIHGMHVSKHMDTLLVRMYIEIALTYCLRHQDDQDLSSCDEMDGLNHRLCHARLYPSPDDELVVQQVSVVCDDDPNFSSVTGLSVPELLKASIKELESSPDVKYKMVHQGEPYVIPSLDSTVPIKLSFVVAYTNCSKYINIHDRKNVCFIDTLRSSMACHSSIYMAPNSKDIERVIVSCKRPSLPRLKRSLTLDNSNSTTAESEIQDLVSQALEKLEMVSLHRYKQRVLKINSYSSKLTSGKVTTIDFDVGYTACLKYEWVENITSCQILEHLPRRRCVAEIYERLWINTGKNIDVNCEDDETPLEAHIEFESAELAMQLAKQALKHIEAKYPHPSEQKVVRIFTLEKQVIAGLHYRLKMEVGFTNCTALSNKKNCVLVADSGLNKFCRVNVWIRPWTDHSPNFRVSCDYQDNFNSEIHHQIQAQHLFYDFLATYKPEYINDHVEMMRRFKIFEKNIERIHFLNTHERGTATYAVTRFADLSDEEFSSKYLGLKPSLKNSNNIPMRHANIPEIAIPDEFDWRDHDAVTEVKDQGSCGSCWAFSVTGNIEGQWKMKSGQLVSLSEQELVDCDKLDEGCNGGLPDNAYRAIEQLGGLELENDYPYEGEDDKCAFNKTMARVKISGAVNITSNETDMAKWLVQNGPISIGINANAMQFYVGGVSHPWKMLCNPKNLDHGVLIVGYGIKDYPLFHKRLPFWTIKNSWGKSWGEQGYYRVYRGDGTCGVNQMASSAII